MLPYTPDAVAEALLTVLDQAAVRRGRALLAIPGGRSPGPVLAALARQLDPGLRARLHLLWLDERAVPPGHADRNDAPTLSAWRAGGADPAHIHPMPAEAADLDAAAAAYAGLLAELGGAPDACLVGIGEDGHLASLFPNHALLDELAAVAAIRDSPKPPPRRLTMTFAAINRAAAIAVLALGAGKAAAAAAARRGADRAVPASLLPADRTTWFLDDACQAALPEAR
jgi:6-phosphogluconolactonase